MENDYLYDLIKIETFLKQKLTISSKLIRECNLDAYTYHTTLNAR